MRKEFTMTQEQYDKIIESCRPVPLIALNLGMPRSPQENANTAWCKLGDEMGFDGMTAKPASNGNKLCFTAEEKIKDSSEENRRQVSERRIS